MERFRNRIYKGRCPGCGRTSILKSYSYDPKMYTFEIESQCLKCGNTEGLELLRTEQRKNLQDIGDWIRRCDFTERIHPKVVLGLLQLEEKEATLRDVERFLGGGEEK